MANQQHFTQEWLGDGQILCYRFRELGRESADDWYAHIQPIFQAWDTSRPLHMMMDGRAVPASRLITPHPLKRARQLMDEHPAVLGRTAVIIGHHLTANIISTMLRTIIKPNRRARSIFHSESDAIAWLLRYEDPNRSGRSDTAAAR